MCDKVDLEKVVCARMCYNGVIVKQLCGQELRVSPADRQEALSHMLANCREQEPKYQDVKPAQCHKCHACHTKRRLIQTQVDVAKCHACHAK